MQTLTWLDIHAIVDDLCHKYPEVDPEQIRFTDLHRWVCELENFKDDPKRSNERILEAIQMAWIEEVEK